MAASSCKKTGTKDFISKIIFAKTFAKKFAKNSPKRSPKNSPKIRQNCAKKLACFTQKICSSLYKKVEHNIDFQ
jgi:hypothetical protein